MHEPTGLEPYTPVEIVDTSATERAVFRRCRRQWFLSVAHRLQSVEGNTNFWLGNLVHAALEVYYTTIMERGWSTDMEMSEQAKIHDDAVGYAFDAYVKTYEESLEPIREVLGFLWANVEPTYHDLGELGFGMVSAYFDRELHDPLFDEILEVERRVDVPIRSPSGRKVGSLSVRADVVGRHQGMLAAADHKTASREVSESQLDLDDQLTAEAYAVLLTRDEFPEEMVYNVLMKKVALPPKRLKDGKGGVVRLSKDKSQPTTWDLYREELYKHRLTTDGYEDILDFLFERDQRDDSPFFRRTRVLRSESQLASFEVNLYYEWRDIKHVASHPEWAYPNPSAMNCPSCPVKLICTTMQDDGDVAAVIKAEYSVGDPRR